MSRFAPRLGAVLLVLSVAIPATASAPADQYATFNQHDATIADKWTHLRWQRDYAAVNSWDDAAAYCASLSLAGGPWRVPSVKELLTLVDEELTQRYVNGAGVQTYAIDMQAFPSTPSGEFWAWPKLANGNAWKVDFASGESKKQIATRTGLFVRCVH